MGFLPWLQENWLDLLQSAAIVGGFITIVRDKKIERVQNRNYFTQRHAQIKRRQASDPRLWRIEKRDADLAVTPVTETEETFVSEVFENFAATVYASKNGVFTQPQALPQDIRSYFNLPIPKEVWERSKKFYDPDFVKFVESHFSSKH
jgi:hypothetical protein